MPRISTPLQQALAASAAARPRLLNTDFMLMCEMDSNIRTESLQEKQCWGQSWWRLLCSPAEAHFSTDWVQNQSRNFCIVQTNFPHHKKTLQKLSKNHCLLHRDISQCFFFPLTYSEWVSVGVVVMEMDFERGICVGVVHLRWRVGRRSTPAHPELRSPGRLSASSAWRLTEPLWRGPAAHTQEAHNHV